MLFCDSFDHYSNTELGMKWNGGKFGSATLSSSSPGGRSGTGKSLSVPSSSDYVRRTIGATTSFVTGFGLYVTTLSSCDSTVGIFRGLQSGSEQVRLCVGTSGQLIVRKGDGTALTSGTSDTGTIVEGVWAYVEFKCTISTSIGASSCLVKVNGLTVVTVATGQSTQNTGTANIDQYDLRGNGGTLYFDDHYFCNQTGSNADFLGDVSVAVIYPSGNGDTNQFTNSNANSTNNYTYVDETSPDNDTTYVKDAVFDEIDLYAYDDLPGTATSVYAVQRCMFARKDDSGGSKNAAGIVKTGGTVYAGSSVALADNYTYYCDVLDVNPNTTSAWSVSEVNGAQFGIKVAT